MFFIIINVILLNYVIMLFMVLIFKRENICRNLKVSYKFLVFIYECSIHSNILFLIGLIN